MGLTVTVALAEVHPHIGRIQLFIPDFKNMLTNVASSILMLKLRLCSMENLAAFILNVQPVKVYHFNASFFSRFDRGQSSQEFCGPGTERHNSSNVAPPSLM